MDLPLPGAIGALVGIGVGVMDFGLVATLMRRALGRRIDRMSPKAMEGLMRGLFVVNACLFGALGWWFGVSMAGTGLPPVNG
jgi:hypothetical protein